MSDNFKDRSIKVRIPSDLEGHIAKAASAFHQTASGLARVLLEEFVKAYDLHGHRLAWPPRLAYYEAAPTSEPTPKTEGKLDYARAASAPRRQITAEGKPEGGQT